MYQNSKLTNTHTPNYLHLEHNNLKYGTVAVTTVSPVAEGPSSQGTFWSKKEKKLICIYLEFIFWHKKQTKQNKT